MKKLLLLFVMLSLLISCVPEEDNLKFHVEFVPVESVEVPETVTPGHTYDIKLKYRKPTDCHYFDGFYYEANGSVRVVAIQTMVIENANCQPLVNEELETASFDFVCSPAYNADSYVFKFYKGEDGAGIQQYLEIEVPVVQ
jgi:hypothetical protein